MSDKMIKEPTVKEALNYIKSIVKLRRDAEAQYLDAIAPVGYEMADLGSLYDSLEYAQRVKMNVSPIEELIGHAIQQHNKRIELSKDLDKLNKFVNDIDMLIMDLDELVDLELPLVSDLSGNTLKPVTKAMREPKRYIEILNPEMIYKVYQNPPQKKYPIKIKTPNKEEIIILGYGEVDNYLGLSKNSTHTRVKTCKKRHPDGSIPYMGYNIKVLSVDEFERLTGAYNDK